MAYERDLGVTHDWNGTLKTGNQDRSDLVAQYMAFVREDQKKAGVEISRAPALLYGHLAAIIAHMALHVRCTQDPYHRTGLARDKALFTVAFSTTKRGGWAVRSYSAYYGYQMNAASPLISNGERRCEMAPII